MIASGVLLIEPDVIRPPCFKVEAESNANDWLLLKQTLTPQELEAELAATGWTFFFMAGTIRTTVFGFDRDKLIYAALKRCIQAVKLQRCNCLQIESVKIGSFLRLPYVSMSVRPRHIQRGILFAGTSPLDGADLPGPELHREVPVT
jgi:hypothetical protein